jgi:MFS family permease
MQKYVSIYGSVYAIADISYSFAYAVGPIVAGHIVEHYGFTMLNVIVAVISIAYAPALYFLKDMYNYKVKDRKHTVDDKFLILNYIVRELYSQRIKIDPRLQRKQQRLK